MKTTLLLFLFLFLPFNNQQTEDSRLIGTINVYLVDNNKIYFEPLVDKYYIKTKEEIMFLVFERYVTAHDSLFIHIMVDKLYEFNRLKNKEKKEKPDGYRF